MLKGKALQVWQGRRPKLKDNGEVDRSASLLQIGRVIYDAGATRGTVLPTLAERDKALGWRKYSDNRDGGQREYERIFEKLKESGRNSHTPPPEPATMTWGARQPPEKSWPQMGREAYRGIFGEAVDLIDPHIEGDPAAVVDKCNGLNRKRYRARALRPDRCNQAPNKPLRGYRGHDR